MLGFTAILSVSLSLLLASQSVVSGPSPAPQTYPHSPLLSIRQSGGQIVIAPQCQTPCTKMEHSLDSATSAALCTNTIMSQAEACYDCNAKYGADTIAYLQNDINTFVASCAALGVPVKSVTIVAKSAGERLSLGISGPVVGLAALFLVVL
ncbi:hypothetical protein DFH08DRAFT_1084536 [Mycena albidolilacea]|uniref:Uncharacterized protein n=1 Tax=Mycena albidolilacea TaxID=1033008 RepID=A0AAD6ZLU8_9AGAR|nr:hypothetical protein DFH08DRAFT_1084536 [Mycena albidolilacea]